LTTLTDLRADADALARQLPGLTLNAAAADVIHPGAAGRKRAGSGEQFWQFRHYAQTDAADRIDWRRSARSDEYFVRETELETARTILFWADPHAGFNWSNEPSRETKADRAKVLMLAIAVVLAKSGERVGLLNGGRPASLGKSASDRLATDFLQPASEHLTAPKSAALTVVASDFYDPIDVWRKRLAPLAGRCRDGVLLAVSDPAEHDFPYTGRTKFNRPGSDLARIFGRAETVKAGYIERFQAHQTALEHLAASMGWALVKHRTDTPALQGAAALQLALQGFGARL